MELVHWEAQFERFVAAQVAADAAHDLSHIRRVVATAKKLALQTKADLYVVIPAAWLHDCVVVGKSDPLRHQASRLSAQRARAQLISWFYPNQYLADICHAIEAHSFSAQIPARSIEAQILQDADRLDALGAIGIARCFSVGGNMQCALYHDDDPFCEHRSPDDQHFSVDHFYQKLLQFPQTMSSDVGRQEALQRVAFMQSFLEQLHGEIGMSHQCTESSSNHHGL